MGAAPACPGAGACTAQCATINANFKKGVAAETVKNLTAGICGGNTSNATTTTALAKSCSDATAKAFCDALVAGGCTTANGFPNFAAQCLVTANGLTGTGTGAAATLGRAALYDCINNNATHDCTTCQDLVKGSP